MNKKTKKVKSCEIKQFAVCPQKWDQGRKHGSAARGLLSKTLGQLDAEKFPRVAGAFYLIGEMEGKLANISPNLHRAASWIL